MNINKIRLLGLSLYIDNVVAYFSGIMMSVLFRGIVSLHKMTRVVDVP